MKLIPNWREVASRAHSMWAFFLSVVLLVLPDLIYLVARIDTNPRLWWFLALVALIYGIWGRLVDQGMTTPKDRTTTRSPAIVVILAVAAVAFIVWGSGQRAPSDFAPENTAQAPQAPEADPAEQAFLDVAVPLVGKWEGLRLTAYLDPVGILTVCYGETEGVKPGDTYTKAECDEMLARRILEYRAGMHGYFTIKTLAERLPPERDAAYSSLAYNVGVAGAGKSTATRRLNAGDIPGGCDALTWWNKAGGRVLRGLVRRRSEERALCMVGVAA